MKLGTNRFSGIDEHQGVPKKWVNYRMISDVFYDPPPIAIALKRY